MGDLGITGCQIALLWKHMSSGCSGTSHFQKHVRHLLQGIFSLFLSEPGEGNTTLVNNLFSCVRTGKASTNKTLVLCVSLFSPIYFPLAHTIHITANEKSSKGYRVEKKTKKKQFLGEVVLVPGGSSGLLRCEVSLLDQNISSFV